MERKQTPPRTKPVKKRPRKAPKNKAKRKTQAQRPRLITAPNQKRRKPASPPRRRIIKKKRPIGQTTTLRKTWPERETPILQTGGKKISFFVVRESVAAAFSL